MKRNHTIIAAACAAVIFLTGSSAAQNRARQVRPRTVPAVTAAKLTPEQEKETMDYLRKEFPEEAKRFEELKVMRPEAYHTALVRYYAKLKLLETIKQNDPERYEELIKERELDIKSRELARKYRESSDEAEKEKISAELEQLLYKIFEYRQLNRQAEIERIEKKLEELKKENALRLESKDEMVRRQLAKLLGEQEELEW
ncbi:hypothetical protein JXO52_10720 [bacterium]|nr:hypothetical protein [bacterium]